MDKSNIEKKLELQILAQYALSPQSTTWLAHDNIGYDDIAHYFSCGDKKYVLVWSDHPNTTFIHEEKLPPVRVKDGIDEWLHVESGELEGYYSLYEDTDPAAQLADKTR